MPKTRKGPAINRAQAIEFRHRQVTANCKSPSAAAQHLIRRFGVSSPIAELLAMHAGLGSKEARHG